MNGDKSIFEGLEISKPVKQIAFIAWRQNPKLRQIVLNKFT
jgi:hypothetical protein